MPLLLHKKLPHAEIMFWQLTEDLSFFLDNTRLGDEESALFQAVSHPAKQKEFLASRMLLKLLVPNGETYKDEHNKPHLLNKDGHISIAHCKGFVAVMYSNEKQVGIDVEPIHPKVERVAYKFMAEEELRSISIDNRIEDLIIHWSVKEAVYKWYSKKNLSFKRDILVQEVISEKDEKLAFVKLSVNDERFYIRLAFLKLESCIFTYTLN